MQRGACRQSIGFTPENAAKQQGTSYRQLLQQVRQDFAEQRLHENIQSITDIALQLGYAETAVFSRHFRRWTGKSPRQWRQEKTQLQTFKPIS